MSHEHLHRSYQEKLSGLGRSSSCWLTQVSKVLIFTPKLEFDRWQPTLSFVPLQVTDSLCSFWEMVRQIPKPEWLELLSCFQVKNGVLWEKRLVQPAFLPLRKRFAEVVSAAQTTCLCVLPISAHSMKRRPQASRVNRRNCFHGLFQGIKWKCLFFTRAGVGGPWSLLGSHTIGANVNLRKDQITSLHLYEKTFDLPNRLRMCGAPGVCGPRVWSRIHQKAVSLIPQESFKQFLIISG